VPDQVTLPSLRETLRCAAPTLPSLCRIGDQIMAAGAGDAGTSGLPTRRIAVLGSVTTDYLARAIACGTLLEGCAPVVHQVPFGIYAQEILDSGSALHAFRPEVAVVALCWRDLIAPLPIDAPPAAVDAALDAKVAFLAPLWDRLIERGACVIQHALVPPASVYRGMAERRAPAAPANQARRLNEKLVEAGQGRVHWLDMEALAASVGTRQFSASRLWHSARLDFDPRWLPDYLALFRAAWRAAQARAKKVLVVDLDNTLWGGVIGDDGVDGIVLGPGSAAGEAFAEWQGYVKALAERGVVLAACSKNDPDIAAGGLAHPNCVLRRADFAAFACAWSDKADGLRRIARELNLGLDSFVFADDNAAECALVRASLPEVAVVELGSDPAQFIDLLDAGHWFDAPGYTREDLGRAGSYAARAVARAEQARATNVADFLAGLEMKGRLYRPDDADIPRMAQLEQKTNQFNLTTRRYAEADLRALLRRDDMIVLAFRLSDRLADHGLVSSLVARQTGETLCIDSWLMSCRVFSRTAEQFMLGGLANIARERGATRLLGAYVPSAKNALVADLYARLGFARGDQEGTWIRPVAGTGNDGMHSHITAAAR
jgi:FkbH-like protein